MAKSKSKKSDDCGCGDDCNCGCGCYSMVHKHAGTGSIYGLGFIGAAIYYISTATSFWIGVLGILKAIVWPAFVVFELLKYLGA